MQIFVDGQPKEVPDGASVAQVLDLLDEPVNSILVEVNGAYVRRSDYPSRTLRAGDHLEVILPAHGG